MNIWTDVGTYSLYKAILSSKEFKKWEIKFIAYLDWKFERWKQRLAKQQQNGDSSASRLSAPKLASNSELPKIFLKYVQYEVNQCNGNQ